MSIESTEFITKDEAIDKILYYLSIKYQQDDFSKYSAKKLDYMLHSLKYELDVDILSNYIIVDEKGDYDV